ncbi:ribonuclease III [Candidatus Microgenomates bacterium]|nr:ribonuclease III [Candidatus Microgenomates bacterium]
MKTNILQKIRDSFLDKELFDTALTHRSWVNEHPNSREHNERLEFLGDAVLELIVSKQLYLQFPNEKEGFMTNLRANLVNTVNLSLIGMKLNLGESLFLSKGEEESGGRTNQSLLADTTEALIGAIYLDQGIDVVEKFISEYLLSDLENKLNQPLKDAKSRLQEAVQSQGFPAPRYKVISEVGPDHAKEFSIQVEINNKAFGTGSGKSKAEAEQKAAQAALSNFTN